MELIGRIAHVFKELIIEETFLDIVFHQPLMIKGGIFNNGSKG